MQAVKLALLEGLFGVHGADRGEGGAAAGAASAAADGDGAVTADVLAAAMRAAREWRRSRDDVPAVPGDDAESGSGGDEADSEGEDAEPEGDVRPKDVAAVVADVRERAFDACQACEFVPLRMLLDLHRTQ